MRTSPTMLAANAVLAAGSYSASRNIALKSNVMATAKLCSHLHRNRLILRSPFLGWNLQIWLVSGKPSCVTIPLRERYRIIPFNSVP
jgi:hypothetical protein